MALLLLLLPSSLSLALSPPPPPPPFFPPQWAPPVPGGGGPFAEHGVGYGSGPDGSHNPTVSSVHGNQYMPTGRHGMYRWPGRRT
ncbi:hypothetical protein OsI_05516 [Oryza sativa Indica Group]|uniref:Os02g0107800 protein n=6 Tax=Oryza TaxID=4527 RepID=A3A2A0_ORYSJ|nr:hypothetical protein OsI_05516 [Oryza sativa Indica Group]EAZ21439.1 hypothetical protein OsJ_05041 [Oryza sativa Japonica Group]BAH91499.1 Os02g0107800 [Oryza sativa Japonica Group]|eukprot:NP_001172770.1 Os02g0107800 [Oryza sativa Japonica Group]